MELEREMSVTQQFLDALIVRRLPGIFTGRLPDGLDNLAEHNLLTYKSLHEPLDDWALKELTHHYVAYRKLVSGKELLPESAFRLYRISTRFPEKLSREVGLTRLQPGVYEVQRGTDAIRIIVLSEIPRAEHNALWHMFSGKPELVQFGASSYEKKSDEIRGVIDDLYGAYKLEGITMPYTLENFRHDYLVEHLKDLPPDERLKGLPPEERIKGLSPEELLRGLQPEVIEAYLRRIQTHDNGGQPKDAEN